MMFTASMRSMFTPMAGHEVLRCGEVLNYFETERVIETAHAIHKLKVKHWNAEHPNDQVTTSFTRAYAQPD